MNLNQIKTRRVALFALTLILICAAILYARAGGGGGYSGGGGGGFSGGGYSGGGYSGGGSYSGDGDPLGFLFGLIIFIGISISKARSDNSHSFSGQTTQVEKKLKRDQNKGKKRFILGNPEFELAPFKNLVRTRFFAIQKAWCAKDLSSVRRFISDGVWQRFNVQIDMMNRLQQTDTMTNISVQQISIDSYEEQGDYDIIHVGIKASCNDSFTCALDSSLNHHSFDKFIEYWSFIRKRGVSQGALSENSCPSCGTPLPEHLGEVAQCPSCDVMVNSAEYDWILSEITQSDDWAAKHGVKRHRHTAAITRQLSNEHPDFCRQLIEDKASNAYLQVLVAQAINEPQRMRRFVSDDLYKRIITEDNDSREILYNQLMLRDVSLVGIRRTESKDILYVAVKESSMRVSKLGSAVSTVDHYPMIKEAILEMTRDRGVESSKYSIYLHQCSSCGGPVPDTTDLACSYCGSTLNSTSRDWIITDTISHSKFNQYKTAFKNEFSHVMNDRDYKNIYKHKDYLINNLLAMAYVDGIFSSDEEQFINEIASHVRYPKEALEQLKTEAKAKRLAIKMPDDIKSQEKVLQMMRRFSEIDGCMSYNEEVLLESLYDSYGLLAPQEFKVTI